MVSSLPRSAGLRPTSPWSLGVGTSPWSNLPGCLLTLPAKPSEAKRRADELHTQRSVVLSCRRSFSYLGGQNEVQVLEVWFLKEDRWCSKGSFFGFCSRRSVDFSKHVFWRFFGLLFPFFFVLFGLGIVGSGCISSGAKAGVFLFCGCLDLFLQIPLGGVFPFGCLSYFLQTSVGVFRSNCDPETHFIRSL